MRMKEISFQPVDFGLNTGPKSHECNCAVKILLGPFPDLVSALYFTTTCLYLKSPLISSYSLVHR